MMTGGRRFRVSMYQDIFLQSWKRRVGGREVEA